MMVSIYKLMMVSKNELIAFRYKLRTFKPERMLQNSKK